MSYRAADVPPIRDELSEWLLRAGPAVYEGAIRAGKQNMKPPTNPTRGAAILAAEEIRRLASAELFFVSADMTDLAVAAAKSLPAFSLMPEDLPSPSGFVLFQRPIVTSRTDAWSLPPQEDGSLLGGDVQIVAASWSHWDGGGQLDWPMGGAWITFFDDRDSTIETGVKQGIIRAEQVDMIRRRLPRVGLANEVQTPFSAVPRPVSVAGAPPVNQDELTDDGMHRWVGVLKATWLLMQQPIASVTVAANDRAARRRYERQAKPVPLVRIITLRRPANPSGSGENDREYHHQWVVRGHWRQQWYASRNVHRPVWIAPHVKGPEGAPMLGGERVYSWSR